MFDTDFLSNWRAESKEMNRRKEGAKNRYPNSLIWLLATVHVYLFPYRELEGFLRWMSVHVEELKAVPDFTNVVESIKNPREARSIRKSKRVSRNSS